MCEEGGCCPNGKGGMYPASIHDRLAPAGFVLKVAFDGSGLSNATWSLQAGIHGPSDKCDGGGCATTIVAKGPVDWAIGEWRTLKLSAKRQPGTNVTQLKWSVLPVGGGKANGEALVQTAEVATVEEARAGIAIGNSITAQLTQQNLPLSQWDNLTVVAVV